MKRNTKIWLSVGLVAAMAAAGSAMAADNPPSAPTNADSQQQVQTNPQSAPDTGAGQQKDWMRVQTII